MNLIKISYISALLVLGFMLVYLVQYTMSPALGDENEMSHAQTVVELDNEVIVSLKIRNIYDESKRYAYEILIDDESHKLGNSVVVPGRSTVEVGASFSRDRLKEKITVLLYDDEKLVKSTNYYVSKGGELYG